MGGDPNSDFAPADQQIGVMVLRLSHTSDRVDEVDGLDEVLELVSLDQLGTLDAPACEGTEP
jgi:hypothetical protein